MTVLGCSICNQEIEHKNNECNDSNNFIIAKLNSRFPKTRAEIRLIASKTNKVINPESNFVGVATNTENKFLKQ